MHDMAVVYPPVCKTASAAVRQRAMLIEKRCHGCPPSEDAKTPDTPTLAELIVELEFSTKCYNVIEKSNDTVYTGRTP